MRDLFRVAAVCEPERVRSEAELEADEGEGQPTWAEWAAHLLGTDDMSNLAIVQDDGPDLDDGTSPIDVLQESWDDFVVEKEIPDERTGYNEIALGKIYGVPAVRFYDTGYSAMVFRTADIEGD